MPPLAVRGAVNKTLTPPIPKAQAWIKHFPATPSRPLLNLSQGVPGEAPEAIFTDKVAELSRSREPANYGSIQGDDGLREAVKEEMRDVYRWDEREARGVGVGVEKDQTAISSGCNQAFYLTMSTLCTEGDEVIIPCPWVSLSTSDCTSLVKLTRKHRTVLQYAHDLPATSPHSRTSASITVQRLLSDSRPGSTTHHSPNPRHRVGNPEQPMRDHLSSFPDLRFLQTRKGERNSSGSRRDL